MILRAYLDPNICHSIPNAVDFSKFKPEQKKIRNDGYINIVSISRQVFRKGTDLLIEIIPEICHLFHNVNFLIGGDGPKKNLLENMIESSNLQNRVILFGSLPHNKVRDIMIQGDIYFNPSLTEAFCIAILEAASTGLYIIATDVGGVREVLPDSMICLVEAEKSSIINGIKKTIENFSQLKKDTETFHNKLKSAYNWDKVLSKTVPII